MKDYIPSHWIFIGHGTEGDVYKDTSKAHNKPRAYKVIPFDRDKEEEVWVMARNMLFQHMPNVVRIYGSQRLGDGWMAIEMELLEPLRPTDLDEYDYINNLICTTTKDKVVNLKKLLTSYKMSLEIRRMVLAMQMGAQQLGVDVFDFGFHNLMYCPITKTYKLIDVL